MITTGMISMIKDNISHEFYPIFRATVKATHEQVKPYSKSEVISSGQANRDFQRKRF